MEFIVILVIIAVIVFLVKENRRKAKNNEAPATQAGGFYPCVITGNIGASPKDVRVEALRIEAASKGIAITGNYDADVAAQGGEMTLLGTSFKFTVDAAGQVVPSESHLNLFLVDYPVQGGMTPDGKLAMAVNVDGVYPAITGRIVNGQLVDGRVTKGWLPHIWGVLDNAVWTKT